MAEVPLTIPAGDSTELPYPALAPEVLRPRNWCLKVACSPWLECVSILVRLVNCMILLVYMSERSYQPRIVDTFVVAFFNVEMLITMLANRGFGYEGSYLSDCWNMLDLFINSAVLSFYFLESLA